jgi:hypothetical protein
MYGGVSDENVNRTIIFLIKYLEMGITGSNHDSLKSTIYIRSSSIPAEQIARVNFGLHITQFRHCPISDYDAGLLFE